MMNTNLLLATGLAYALLGALVLFVSHLAIYRSATCIVAGYPRVLARLRAKRHDGRLGLGIVVAGIALQALAAAGYSAPLELWPLPAAAAGAALLAYGVRRLLCLRAIARPVTDQAGKAGKALAPGLFETRRSLCLREAARVQAESLHAREAARGPRQTSVVYLSQEWERRWWSDKFGVSADAIRAAVRQVGPMAQDLERHLKGNGAQITA